MKITENQVNKDHNGVEMMIGKELDSFFLDLTGNGDGVKLQMFDNDVWAVTDDLQGNHCHFTEDIEATIEAYIEHEETEERKEKFQELLKNILD